MRMNSEFIYHVILQNDWEQVCDNDHYSPGSLAEEGFIHFSFEDQIPGVIERYYQNQESLLILKIDINKLKSKLKLESVAGYGEFPHLFGKLNLDSVTDIYKILRDDSNELIWQLFNNKIP
ncbi:MAG: DUF952 domain-containing protein [Anaerolineaceae bacterium]|nr:DUF952 domain-containing protein [Anaerolineaceae bacterium]